MLKNSLRLTLRLFAKPFLSPRYSVAFQRHWTDLLMLPNVPARGTSFDLINLNAVPARMIRTASSSAKVVLYMHGGAYILGNPKGHRALCSHLAQASNATVYSLDYRLAPEHPYPAARDDALAAYRQLLDDGISASDIALAGDSAGAGLALCAALNIRDQGLPLPGRLFLISPFVDMTLSSESMKSKARSDPMLREDWLRSCGDMYRGDTSPEHPDCSPLFADLHDLPPTLIHVGSDEILLDDATQLAAKLQISGCDVELRQFEGYWHDFQLQAGLLPMAGESLREAGKFLNSGNPH